MCLHELWQSFPESVIQSSWCRADVCPLDLYPDGDAVEQLQQLQLQDTSEVAELISALPAAGELVDAESYITDVEGENVPMNVPASFFLPIRDADRDSPDADSGDTLPVVASADSSEQTTGTEELNVPMPADTAVLSLTQACTYFEENTHEFDVNYVTQLTRMLNSLYEHQARIAMRRSSPLAVGLGDDGDPMLGIRASSQNEGLNFMCHVVLNSVHSV